jgi:translocation and assembly module TamB
MHPHSHKHINKTPKKPLKKSILRWLKHLYVALHSFLVFVLLVAAALFYTAFHPKGLEVFNTFFLKPMGIQYQLHQGSLKDGLVLHNIHSDSIDIKSLNLDYNLTSIIKGKHTIDSIHIDGLRINLDDFLTSDTSNSPFVFPKFILKEVKLTNIQLMSTYPIELNINGRNGSFDGTNLNFNEISASVRTQYASGALKGILKNNTITGKAIVYPNAHELDTYVADFVTLPQAHLVDIIELNTKGTKLQTRFETINANFDPALLLHDTNLTMEYRFSDDFINFSTTYIASRDSNTLQATQKLRYDFSGITTTALDGQFLTSSIALPSKKINAVFRDDSQGVRGKISLDNSFLLLNSSDYEVFNYTLNSTLTTLDFIPNVPQPLQKTPLQIDGHGNYVLASGALKGDLKLTHEYFKGNITALFQDNNLNASSHISFSPDMPLWQTWIIKPPLELDLKLEENGHKTYLQVSGEGLELSVEHKENTLKGSGNYLNTYIDIDGLIDADKSDIKITSSTPSLAKTLQLIPKISLPKYTYIDAQINTTTHIVYDTALLISTDVKIPWYAVMLDSKNNYGGVNSSLALSYRNNHILVDNFSFDIANQIIHSTRPSLMHLEENTFFIDEIWLFDAAKLYGNINIDSLATSLFLQTDKLTYKSPEGNITIASDMHYVRDVNGSQTLLGDITILDGVITYLPLQQIKILDDDVVIVQDVTQPNQSKFQMDIKIISRQPIRYLTKELNIYLSPDLTLWKEPFGDMQILGMITAPRGTISTAGKYFTLRPSYIYFAGELPINPYLDIGIDHEVDYKKIQIYITHRLDSPIFLFNSDPIMSQNDIMSYVLFGASSADTFKSNSSRDVSARADATNFMLGAGLKGLIGGTTGLQIDTMNILTTKEGGMGFEVGARLNKDLRVVYKNDTVSSVLLQYTVNQWLRLDADIRELGQGINAIYIKDFRDILPHSKTKPKTTP